MAKFNQTNTRKTVNKSGHVAYRMEDKEKLATMVLTTMFGEPKSYGDNTSELVDLAERSDMEFVAHLAVYARKEMHLRSVSHALTAIVANRGKEYTRWVVRGVVERPDDITEILACYLNMYGKPVPNALKKALAEAICYFNEYQFAKYNGGNKQVKFRDVLRITHPKSSKHQAEIFGKILNDTLETPYTWETQLSERGNNRKVWEELIENNALGYMAMLRNMRNIITADPKNINKVYAKISDPEAVRKSKQLPFRFLSAYREIAPYASSKALDAIEAAADVSVENMERIPGKTLIAIDVSGSMTQSVSQKSSVSCADIARMIGSMAAKICDDCEVYAFDNNIRKVAISSHGGVISNAMRIPVTGGGTNIRLPFDLITDNEKHFDRVILLSDNEINSGWRSGGKAAVQSSADEYRRKVNPGLWVHAIDLVGYGTQQFIGSRTNILAGWNERVIEFINIVERGGNKLVQEISQYPIDNVR